MFTEAFYEWAGVKMGDSGYMWGETMVRKINTTEQALEGTF